MNNLVEKLENITIKEDLFKDVTYFVTGELQPKVIFFSFVMVFFCWR